MPANQLTQTIFQLAEAPVASLGLDLIDVEIARASKGGPRTLRLIVDKRGGVSMDDCAAVSRLVDPLIDSRSDIGGYDYFEVSSPGLDRPLKTARDLARHQGEFVELKLYRALNGQKTFRGKLAPCTDAVISLDLEDGSQMAVESQTVAKIKRVIAF